MAYSEKTDLLIGDLLIAASFDQQSFVDRASEEIDSKLGFYYKLPLRLPVDDTDPPEPEDELVEAWKKLPYHQMLLLKGMANKLASGRLILAVTAAEEGTTLHGYGWQLVKEATAELMLVANGEVQLDAVKYQYNGETLVNAPVLHNEDEESLVAGFSENVMRRHYSPWPRTHVQPGSKSTGYFG